MLQEENDELYELLRYNETGKLKEEVRGLRRLVQRLQGALRRMWPPSSAYMPLTFPQNPMKLSVCFREFQTMCDEPLVLMVHVAAMNWINLMRPI